MWGCWILLSGYVRCTIKLKWNNCHVVGSDKYIPQRLNWLMGIVYQQVQLFPNMLWMYRTLVKDDSGGHNTVLAIHWEWL